MTTATVEVEIDLYDIEDDIIEYVKSNKEDFRYIFDNDNEGGDEDVDMEFVLDNITDKSIVFELLQNSPAYECRFKNLSEKLVSIINRLSEKLLFA